MKKITALMVTLCMVLSLFGTAVFAEEPADTAASMTMQEFVDALNGKTSVSSDYEAQGLASMYKYVSASQIAEMSTYRTDAQRATVNLDNYKVENNVLTEQETADFVKALSLLMTFPSENTKNDVSGQIKDAGETFYNAAFDELDKMTGNTLTKTALGKLLVGLSTNLKDAVSSATDLYTKTSAEEYVKQIQVMAADALAASFTAGDGDLAKAREAMIANGMLTKDGDAISAQSPFIQVVLKAFDIMNEVDGDYDTAAVVANTILVSALDVEILMSNGDPYQPNKSLGTIKVDSNLTFTVKPRAIEDKISDITSWMDFDTSSTIFSITHYDNAIRVTGSKAGAADVRLYRNTVSGEGNDTSIDKLLIELTLNVQEKEEEPTPTRRPGGTTGSSGPIYAGGSLQLSPITISVNPATGLVTLKSPEQGTKIYYTTDGTTPTKDSTLYTGPFPYEEGMVIKAIATYNGLTDSVVSTETIGDTNIPSLTEDHIAYINGYEDGSFRPDASITRAEVAAIFSRLLADTSEVAFTDTFSDVSAGDWYAGAVSKMVKHGIINGYEDGTFKPEQNISRAEYATIASRFAVLSQDAANKFSDVDSGYWAAGYINSAAEKGWINGYDDGTFKPEAAITRAEAVTITNRVLARTADQDYINKNIASLKTFNDVTDAHWAYYGIMEAANAHNYRKSGSVETWEK